MSTNEFVCTGKRQKISGSVLSMIADCLSGRSTGTSADILEIANVLHDDAERINNTDVSTVLGRYTDAQYMANTSVFAPTSTSSVNSNDELKEVHSQHDVNTG